MAKTSFTKTAATPEQLLAKWRSQGLVVSAADEAQALGYLCYVGGYRLKGYWFHLLDPTTKCFPMGYTFAHIAARCELDRALRAATIEAIDRLEVAVRCVMGNYLSLKHSPH